MKTSVTFNKLIVLLLIASAGILAVGCSNKKNSFTRRVYNNLTAHYNTWWNGNEALEEGFTHIETKTPDNYTTILPVFPAFTKKEASAVNPKAERAIEKGSKVIQRNSMFFNKKELNRWIDDSYFMIGKAYYLKQDYRSARRTFEFILTKYKDSPLLWQVTLWLAHTNNAMEQFSKAGNDLERFRIEMMRVQMPRKDLVFFHKVYAEFFLKQNNLPFALPHVLSAMELSHKKIEKNRLRFIAAQIYQSQNQLAEATKLYQSVVNHTPGYEMEFNSRINIAKCYDASAGSSEKIVKALEKMLDDAKNTDYHDQIYYALSEVNFKDHDTTSGIKNLRLSVATSKVNDFQKAQSALQLAEIFFQKPDYQLSKAYYDTTLQATSKESPRYEQLSVKTKVLTQLVDNLVIIQNEDSLQKVASMSESDRNALIDSIIAKIVEEERKKAEEERNRQTSSMMSGGFGREQQTVGGGWYFYNPQALSMGFTEFTRKWGNRRLEDLWRLSNKDITLEDMADNELPADTSALPSDSTGVQADGGKGGKGGSTDPKNRDYYTAKLPLTPEAVVKSDQKIMEALFKAAFIYREGLADLQSSRATFEELVTRYSDTAINKNYLLSCFMISDLSKKLGDDSKAAEYADLIIKGYPSSDYALILKDPSFVEEMAKNNQEASLFYEETYVAYKTGQYYTVLLNNELAHQKFGNKHELMPRFDYLRALAVGNLEIVDSLAVNLQRLVKTYPRDPVASEAMKILDKIARMNPSLAAATGIQKLPDTPEPVAVTSKYKINEKATHSCLVVVKTDSVDVNVLKIRISDFNSKSYSSTNLSISGLLLDNTWQIVNITGFKDMLSAMDYYDALMQNQYVLAPIGTTNHFVFAVSSENYPIFYQSKDLKEYETFFRTNYIKSQTSGK